MDRIPSADAENELCRWQPDSKQAQPTKQPRRVWLRDLRSRNSTATNPPSLPPSLAGCCMSAVSVCSGSSGNKCTGRVLLQSSFFFFLSLTINAEEKIYILLFFSKKGNNPHEGLKDQISLAAPRRRQTQQRARGSQLSLEVNASSVFLSAQKCFLLK